VVSIAGLNWMQVEDYLERDDRIVLPIGSTEQHAYLSLATDTILAGRLALEAAEPLGVPVLPAMPFGVAGRWAAFPGTIALGVDTLAAVLVEALDSLVVHGFRRFLVLNGHGGNAPVGEPLQAWAEEHPGTLLRFHSWWTGPGAAAALAELEPEPAHASWMENFPWTRLPAVTLPEGRKPLVPDGIDELEPEAVRELVGDGSCGGPYARSDEEMRRVWDVAVAEVRDLLEFS
jgi:creatinine amidohydrolase